MSQKMFYVAADPAQPGAAFAACVDSPDHAKDNAKSIASWVRKGANILRVDGDAARDMLLKWERPAAAPRARHARGSAKGSGE